MTLGYIRKSRKPWFLYRPTLRLPEVYRTAFENSYLNANFELDHSYYETVFFNIPDLDLHSSTVDKVHALNSMVEVAIGHVDEPEKSWRAYQWVWDHNRKHDDAKIKVVFGDDDITQVYTQVSLVYDKDDILTAVLVKDKCYTLGRTPIIDSQSNALIAFTNFQVIDQVRSFDKSVFKEYVVEELRIHLMMSSSCQKNFVLLATVR